PPTLARLPSRQGRAPGRRLRRARGAEVPATPLRARRPPRRVTMALETTNEVELRVERCPACGARYNVTRLAPGSRFSCRRCGSAVAVRAAAPEAAPSRTRVALAWAGVALIAGALLRSFPGVYAGAAGSSWSSVVDSLSLPDAVALTLVAVTGGMALPAPAPGARPAAVGAGGRPRR